MTPADLAKLSVEEKRALAAKLLARPRATQAPPLVASPGELRAPLSSAQERMWFTDQFMPGRVFHNVLGGARLVGALDAESLRGAILEVQRRHSILRSCFRVEDGQPFQIVQPEPVDVLQLEDLSALDPAAREAELARLDLDNATRRFALETGPLWRVLVVKVAPDTHVFFHAIHLLANDGWGESVLLRELMALYDAFVQGKPSALPPLPIQYGDFARWQKTFLASSSGEEHLSYWKSQLGGMAPLDLPTDKARPRVQRFTGESIPLRIPPELHAAVTELSRSLHITPYHALFAAFFVLLQRYSRQEDLCVGMMTAGRIRPELHPLVGLFLNLLPIRATTGDDPSFAEFARRVGRTTTEALAHQEVPFERIVEAVQPERELSRSPLFQVQFVSRDNPQGLPTRLHGLKVQPVHRNTAVSQFDLSFYLAAEFRDGALTGAIGGQVEYSTDLFERETIERMVGHYLELLSSAVATPDAPLSRLRWVPAEERARLIARGQRVADPSACDGTFLGRFAERVARHPERTAVSDDRRSLRYDELDARSNQLARRLWMHGVRSGDRVGISLDRSVELAVATLGVMKAGAAYVPLDPTYPAERLAFMLEDSGARIVLTDASSETALATGVQRIFLDRDETFASVDEGPLPTAPSGQDCAYVLYTSGSTGRPKGVMVTHRNLANFLRSMESFPGLGERDVLLAVTSLSFDIAGLELYLPLQAGARVAMAPRAAVIDGRRLAAELSRTGATVMQATPSSWRMLLDAGWVGAPGLAALCGGEALPQPLAEQLLPKVGRLYNLYGPTETTIWSAACEITRGGGEISIGAPIANTQLYVLGPGLEPVPLGVPGELYIGGEGVARGYWNRPELTAERFLPDPFSAAPGARLYRTGDLVRFRSDGALQYLQRTDDQLKIRGHRIELGDIEAALARHPSVRDAAVAVTHDPTGSARLVASVVADEGTFDAAALRTFAEGQLPEYMVPAVFARRDALPRTPNGKLDRKALAALPLPEAAPARADVLGPTAELLAGVWRSVLGVPSVGLRDHFFALGGHSLLAAKVSNRVRELFQVQLPIQTFFEAATLQALAERVERAVGAKGDDAEQRPGHEPAAPAAPPLRRIPRGGPLPTSFSQSRLWFLDQFDPKSAAYNFPSALRLRGPLDTARLEDALAAVVERHEVLRSRFIVGADGNPAIDLLPSTAVRLLHEDLSHVSAEAQGEEVERRIAEELLRPFDLGRGPLIRPTLIALAPQEHVLMIILHHSITDAQSTELLYRDLTQVYAALETGRAPELPPLSFQFADFAAWERAALSETAIHASLAYWKQRLGDVDQPLDLPIDHPRPADQTTRGGFVGEVRLPPALSERVRATAQREGSTLFMLLEAAWHVLLHRYSGQTSISVGTTTSGRPREDLEDVMGMFLNTLVLRVEIDGRDAFRDVLSRTRETVLGAFAHQDVAFARLVEALRPRRDLARSPLFQVMFTYQTDSTGRLEIPGLELSPIRAKSDTAQFELTLNLRDTGTELWASLEYNRDLFERATAERLLAHYQRLLEHFSADPGLRVSAPPLLDDRERHQLTVDWNATATPLPPGRCVHHFFEKQAASEPDRIALTCGARSLRYGELDARANALAAELIRRGVGPEDRVGVCLERSVEMVVALLGVLKAGAAYVPLDPAYPRERILYMLRDSGARLLVTDSRLAAWAGVADPVRIDALGEAAASSVRAGVDPDHPAYVIYTSGSTGQPKGVVVTHRNVANFFSGMDARLGTEPGVWLAVTSISFDIAGLELLWTLGRGFHVVLRREARGGAVAAPAPGRQAAFSLMYFANDSDTQAAEDKYRLLLEGARFADTHGFSAIWIPERHFHEFGGIFPNPSVAAAAVATLTRSIELRSGSVVLPLHHPLRVAEEWSFVDNLSGGRVSLSFASGWHPNDFVLAPDHYARRREVMNEGIEQVRALWRGETLSLPNGVGKTIDVRIRPAPVQKELPIWLTAAGSPETFQRAGQIGAGLLTHLIRQRPEDLKEKIALYREAWRKAGHPGDGRVALMVHTFVGTDRERVRQLVRAPFIQYLRSSHDLSRGLAQDFGKEFGDISPEQMEEIYQAAFESYFETSGLFGTPEEAARVAQALSGLGVDDFACLIDFGVPVDEVLGSLEHLDTVRRLCRPEQPAVVAAEPEADAPEESLSELIVRHRVTHLQCTPSLARVLLLEPEASAALAQLEHLLLGGEALPVDLVERIRTNSRARVLNMYGPTETTIWSATHRVAQVQGSISIGRPIANTRIYIVDAAGHPTPVGVPGELWIGGAGVARGYLHRPDLTAERFVPDPFSGEPGSRLYRTGDLARYRPNGEIEFLGRIDQQAKVRGYRVEPGEIEATLARHPLVREAAVAVRPGRSGDPELVGYVVGRQRAPTLASLREHLRTTLPDYMVPTAFVFLDALPLTPNGKIDRKALPLPASETIDAGSAPPEGELETAVAKLWAEILNVAHVGRDQNFFELGGHSLLAARLVAQLRTQLRFDVPVRSVFNHPTLAAFTAALERTARVGAPDVAALSDSQVEAMLEQMLHPSAPTRNS